SIVSGQVSPSTGLPEEVGYTDAFVMSAVAMFVAFLAALLVPGRRPQAESSSADQHGSAEGRSAEPAPRK
ncbi:MAG: MFS transporter, partial [Solirubrobacterales bacterium]